MTKLKYQGLAATAVILQGSQGLQELKIPKGGALAIYSVRYEPPTPEAEEKKALFEAVTAKAKDYTEAMAALSEIAKNPELSPAEAVAAAKQ